MISGMEQCHHGMEPAWCYLCRVETSGADPRSAWGLDLEDSPGGAWELRRNPMTDGQSSYLRFLCTEFDEVFDPSLTEGEASVVIESFMGEPMSHEQTRTLAWLCEHSGAEMDPDLPYGKARAEIRRLAALRALRSA